MAEVVTECTCGQLPPLPRNQQLDAYDRKRWGATLSDADLDAMRARFAAAELEPITLPCDDCGAEPGEACRPYCTGLDDEAKDEQVGEILNAVLDDGRWEICHCLPAGKGYPRGVSGCLA